MFIVALSFAYFAKAFSGSYVKSSITQIERRFDLPSSIVGFIDGGFEIGNLLVIVFVSNFGAKFHRPKIIAAGCLIMSLGSFLTAMPHFFMGLYKYETVVTPSTNSTANIIQCLPDANQQISQEAFNKSETHISGKGCEKEAKSAMWAYVFLGNALRGIGETPIMPLGVSYVDDFAKEENTGLYFGFILTIQLIGPILGYLLGSVCARLYVDIGFVDVGSVTITPKDSRWVGAWWLGFLVSGAISLFAAIPFCFFPKSLPKQGKEKDSNIKPETSHFIQEDYKESKAKQQVKISKIVKDFWPSLKDLICSPIYTLLLIVSVILFNAFIGLITYHPKYLESQYGQSASKANFYVGVFYLPAVAIGTFLGGAIMKKFKLGIIGAVNLAFVATIIGYLFTLTFFALKCEITEVAGLTVTYEGVHRISYQESTLPAACNSDCKCPIKAWDPVCGDNGITYTSSCLAGCKLSSGTGKSTVFHNCSCIATTGSYSGNFSATLGQCQKKESCDTMLYYFLAMSVISNFIYALGGTPGFIVLIRSTKPQLKAFALGVHAFCTRTLAGIPSPIYFGALIDTTCLKWGTKTCGGQGACRLYNTDAFRIVFLGLIAGLRVIGYSVCIPIIFLVIKQFKSNPKKPSGNRTIEMFSIRQEEIMSGNSDHSMEPKTPQL
ncbi:solute carrier organic anion transporter family member 1C1 [Latimeria chalumnae]|uniref:solute carrier organic anion transporter family member 1C1 n=1 Tax=Latimeria chalumnae TaxID=7897 RepID=UPI0003C12A63